ncbi:MAG: hypothetical protein K8T89_19170 [Planctomycetes bacterium]|nr:hypothetical protein [Planctomycetota bacterium]
MNRPSQKRKLGVMTVVVTALFLAVGVIALGYQAINSPATASVPAVPENTARTSVQPPSTTQDGDSLSVTMNNYCETFTIYKP